MPLPQGFIGRHLSRFPQSSWMLYAWEEKPSLLWLSERLAIFVSNILVLSEPLTDLAFSLDRYSVKKAGVFHRSEFIQILS